MGKEQLDSNIAPSKDRIGLPDPDKDYRGLRIVQAQALNVFSHFMVVGNLGHVIQRYVGEECSSRNQALLENQHQRLRLVYDSWSGVSRDDLFHSLFNIEKAELAADPSDTFLSGSKLGHELFADGQLDPAVGFATAGYPEFQRDVTNYLLQQLCRIYFINPEVRDAAAARRRLAEEETRETALQQLA